MTPVHIEAKVAPTSSNLSPVVEYEKIRYLACKYKVVKIPRPSHLLTKKWENATLYSAVLKTFFFASFGGGVVAFDSSSTP